ncbi:MAG: ABC transporter substrate-binding protein [Lachnospiraceae bacterium]|nr:ABC transporter substrate-binding protein [Lachnospiraceae bacterium]
MAKMINRRDFLRGTAARAGVLALGMSGVAYAEEGTGVETIGGAIGGADGEEVDRSASVQHGTLTLDADRLSVNPMGLWSSSTEVYSMYEMLFQVSNGLGSEMVPVLADGSRGELGGYDHEEGSNVYTFYIHDNIYDHAGNHLTASDVCFSFQMTQDFGQTSGWSVIESWEAADDTTVVMTCSRELTNKGELENIVLRCFMFTEAAYNASASEFNTDECGTGPYTLTEYTEGASVAMEKYADYWQTDDSQKQACQYANVDEIKLIAISEASQKVVALTTGTTEICQNLPADYIEEFMDGGSYGEGFSMATAPANGVNYLEANVSEDSYCNDLNLRLAVFYAVGSKDLCTGLGENAYIPLSTLGSDVFPDYNPEWENWDNYQTSASDIAKAQEYLAQSSYNGEELILLCQSGNTDAAVLVQALLQAAGITCTISALESNVLSTVASDSAEWDLYLNSTRSSDYLANIWSHVMNADSYASGTTEGFVDSQEYQDLLTAALSVNATMEDMDNFWQYTVENAYIMGTNCGLSYIVYPDGLISNMWLNDKSILIPGAFVYEA